MHNVYFTKESHKKFKMRPWGRNLRINDTHVLQLYEHVTNIFSKKIFENSEIYSEFGKLSASSQTVTFYKKTNELFVEYRHTYCYGHMNIYSSILWLELKIVIIFLMAIFYKSNLAKQYYTGYLKAHCAK